MNGKNKDVESVLKILSIIVVFGDGGLFYYTIRRELRCFGVNNTEWEVLGKYVQSCILMYL